MTGFSDESSLAELAMMAEGKTLNNCRIRMELKAEVSVLTRLNEEARMRRLELIRDAVEGRK